MRMLVHTLVVAVQCAHAPENGTPFDEQKSNVEPPGSSEDRTEATKCMCSLGTLVNRIASQMDEVQEVPTGHKAAPAEFVPEDPAVDRSLTICVGCFSRISGSDSLLWSFLERNGNGMFSCYARPPLVITGYTEAGELVSNDLTKTCFLFTRNENGKILIERGDGIETTIHLVKVISTDMLTNAYFKISRFKLDIIKRILDIKDLAQRGLVLSEYTKIADRITNCYSLYKIISEHKRAGKCAEGLVGTPVSIPVLAIASEPAVSLVKMLTEILEAVPANIPAATPAMPVSIREPVSADIPVAATPNALVNILTEVPQTEDTEIASNPASCSVQAEAGKSLPAGGEIDQHETKDEGKVQKLPGSPNDNAAQEENVSGARNLQSPRVSTDTETSVNTSTTSLNISISDMSDSGASREGSDSAVSDLEQSDIVLVANPASSSRQASPTPSSSLSDSSKKDDGAVSSSEHSDIVLVANPASSSRRASPIPNNSLSSHSSSRSKSEVPNTLSNTNTASSRSSSSDEGPTISFPQARSGLVGSKKLAYGPMKLVVWACTVTVVFCSIIGLVYVGVFVYRQYKLGARKALMKIARSV